MTRGDRMGGLLSYLQGPGRHNEHREPHLVTGDDATMAWFGHDELDRATVLQIARELDEPHRLYDVEVPRGHVWHCSLSLRAEEGLKTDEVWAALAQDFVDEMGFTAASSKAPCRWVAVHHGPSAAGNDHIHLAVSLVREDGTKASTFNDYKRAQQAARNLEVKYGLEPLEAREHGYGRRAPSYAETAKQQRRGDEETVRAHLERRVRAYAAASRHEAEFVRRCRSGGLLVRPRFKAGRDDIVAGYAVALRPTRRRPVESAERARAEVSGGRLAGERPIWFGGGHLARDLTLPRLRAGWTGGANPDDANLAGEAVAEWRAAHRGQPIARRRGKHEERHSIDPALWEQCHRDLGAAFHKMRSHAIDDVAGFAQLAHDAAGVLSAWSLSVEAQPGPLARAARDLSRYSQVRAHQVPVRRVPQPGIRDAALLALNAVDGTRGPGSYAILLRQLQNMLRSLHDHHIAAGRLQAARHVEAAVRGDLQQVAAQLPRILGGGGAGANSMPIESAAERLVDARPLARPPAASPLRPTLSGFSEGAGNSESRGRPQAGDGSQQRAGRGPSRR